MSKGRVRRVDLGKAGGQQGKGREKRKKLGVGK